MAGTSRGRARSRSSMRVSTRKLGATFWKMNEMPLSEVMEKKLLQKSENLSVVLSASVSHLSDHAPCGSVSQRMDRFISSSHQRTPSVSREHKHLEPSVRAVDQSGSASSMEVIDYLSYIIYLLLGADPWPWPGIFYAAIDWDKKKNSSRLAGMESAFQLLFVAVGGVQNILSQPSDGFIKDPGHGSSLAACSKFIACLNVPQTENSYRARTQREPIVGVRTRLKDVNNALVTSKELLKIIDRILAQNDQLALSMSLVSALHSELERACLQVNQLIKEQPSDQREMSYLVKCLAEERASYDRKEQAVEVAIESITGELKAERKLRCQYESLNIKLGRKLTETKIKLTNTMGELESEKKARKRMEQVCHTKLLERNDQFDEKNGVVEKLRNQFEAFFKSNKSEKTSCDKITTYSSSTHSRSNKNEEREYGGEVGKSSAESDLHSIELSMDSKRGSFKWTHASTAARDILSTDDEMRATKYIPEIVQKRSSYIQGSVADGFQRGIRTPNTRSSVNLLQQQRLCRLEKKSQRKGDKCELLRHKSVKDLKDKILSSYNLGSGGGHVVQVPRSKQRLSTTSRLGEIGAEGQKQRRISRHLLSDF